MHGVRDAEAHRVGQWRYLRIDRFSASLVAHISSPTHFDAWLAQLMRLEREGRAVEIANLPVVVRQNLTLKIGGLLAPHAASFSLNGGWLAECQAALASRDFAGDSERAALMALGIVPDSYSSLRRVLGVYPLTSIGVWWGFEQWKDRHLRSFATPVAQIEARGRRIRYTPRPAKQGSESRPLSMAQVGQLLRNARSGPFGLPQFSAPELERLAATYAPEFLIDTVNQSDLIGRPKWQRTRPPSAQVDAPLIPDVDAKDPVAFVRLAYAWFDGRVVPQLVYAIWFASRPKESEFDLLGGRLDGLVWRVTLDDDGSVLIADSIHPCGCYHLFFPGERVVRRRPTAAQKWTLSEEAIIAQSLNRETAPTLLVASGSHYLQKVIGTDATPPPRSVGYRLAVSTVPDWGLRAIALGDGRTRSLFSQSGLVERTERLERFVLWPMGILNAGAMRQWGHHATAFVGRRHFDAPELLDEYFARR